MKKKTKKITSKEFYEWQSKNEGLKKPNNSQPNAYLILLNKKRAVDEHQNSFNKSTD